MKIIDFHVHIGRKEHWKEGIHAYQKASGSDFYDRYEELTDPDRFALYLKEAGIEKAVILPEISPITTGVVSNEYVLDFCRDNDTLVPFCTVNPSLVADPGREFRNYIRMGARGVKLYPSYNYFYPNDRALYPIYEAAVESGLPVLVHTGSSIFQGSKIKYAEPIHLDEVAADFPNVVLVMAHGGRGFWYDQAFFLSRIHPNLYLEVSGLPPKNLLNYFPEMEKNIDKIVYGSDWPGVRTIGCNIDSIKRLPLSPESLEKLLYANAARLLCRASIVEPRE